MADIITNTLQIGSNNLILQDAGARQDIATNTQDISDLKDDFSEQSEAINQQGSTNKWNPSEVISNATISNASATIGEIQSGSYNVSGRIYTQKGQNIRWYYSAQDATPTSMAIGTAAFRIAEYDGSNRCLSCTANWVTLPYTVQNENTTYVRLAVQIRKWNMVILNDTNVYQKAYEAYSPDINLPSINKMHINDLKTQVDSIDNKAEVILPSMLCGVAGQQINIYKENLVLNNRLKSLAYIHTRIENSFQNDQRTIWTPTATALTETVRSVEVLRYGLTNVENISMKFVEVPKDTGNGSIKVLIIGDSKVANGYVSYHFLHNFDDDNMSCTLLGTQYDWQTDNRNEGYGSRTAKWFCTNSASPFCKNGAFDFANYLSVNLIDTPDYVFINLGTNDCASLPGSNETFITEFVAYIGEMIASIHSVDPSIVVVVGMCEGCSTVQDTNNAEFLNWDLNQKISRLHKATLASFDNRQTENIYVCPMYMGMDLTQDYNMTEQPLSQRDGDMNSGQGNGKTRMYITDRVHQNEVGYWKNADYMYALVKYIVAKQNA